MKCKAVFQEHEFYILFVGMQNDPRLANIENINSKATKETGICCCPAVFEFRGIHENSRLFHFVALQGGYSISLSPIQVFFTYIGHYDEKTGTVTEHVLGSQMHLLKIKNDDKPKKKYIHSAAWYKKRRF